MTLARVLLNGCGLWHHWLESAPARPFTWFFGACRLALAAVLMVAVAPVRAENAPPKRARMENRFLFVIDTSPAMKIRAASVEQAVLGLLNSGMKGELRNGDTLGLWSYGSRLHTEFPMQVWSEENKSAIAGTVQLHLRQLRYERQGRLEKVWPALAQAAAKSERLTVIFVHDGEEAFRGTPFDEDINAVQKQYRRKFRAGNLAFVTILAARSGEFFDYTVNYPGSVTVPHTAEPLPPPETNAPPVLAVAAAAPAPLPANPPAAPKPLRVIEILKPTPPPVVSTPAIVISTSPAPVPAPAAVIAPPVVAAPPNAVTNEAVAANATLPASPPPQPVALAVATNTRIAPPPSAPPAPVSPPEPAPAVVATAAPAPSAPVSPPSPLPVTIASTGQQAALFVIAISLLTIAMVLVVFLLRRSRVPPQPSLISQSIDRPR